MRCVTNIGVNAKQKISLIWPKQMYLIDRIRKVYQKKNRNIYEINILQQKFAFQIHHNKRQKEFLRADELTLFG